MLTVALHMLLFVQAEMLLHKYKYLLSHSSHSQCVNTLNKEQFWTLFSLLQEKEVQPENILVSKEI